MCNCRPIANLSFISKLTEKIVKKRLLDHLISNSLLALFQSAYTKFYSTETTLLSLHDHLSNAISMQQVSCLCLLDLSSAFHTLDHSILLHRLSTWFGISSVPLQWFTSYLSSRTSTVGIPPHISPLSPRSSPRLRSRPSSFSIFTPLSSFISASSISHLLYDDDTQLFVYFVPRNVSSAINKLQSTITLIHLGCLLIFSLSIPLKLNSFSSVSLSKPLN